MKESASIALTFAKSFIGQVDHLNRVLHHGHVHLHVPEVSVRISPNHQQ